MRENTRTLSLPVGDQSMTFRITRLDAFSGAHLLRMVAAVEGKVSASVAPAPSSNTPVSMPSPPEAAAEPDSSVAESSNPASQSPASPVQTPASPGQSPSSLDQTHASPVQSPASLGQTHASPGQSPVSGSVPLPAPRGINMSDLLFALPEDQFEKVMRTCLSRAEVSLPAGYIRVYMDGCWGVPELEYETLTCLRLTLAEMGFSLEGFFPGGGRPFRSGGSASFR